MKRYLLHALLALIALVGVGFTLRWMESGDKLGSQATAVPADDVRETVQMVKLSEVQSARIIARLYSRQVTDRESLALLLEGLRDARYPDPMPQNRVDSIVLVLREGGHLGPFHFSIDRPEDAFSPCFVAGLKRAGIPILSQL